MKPRLQGQWGALAVLGAVAVMLCALVSIRQPGSGLAAAPEMTLSLAPDDIVAWSFTTERGGLAGFELWLAEAPPPGAELTLQIRSLDDPAVTLSETVVHFQGNPGATPVRVAFPPLWVRASPHAITATLDVQLRPRGPAYGTSIVLLAGTEAIGVPAFTPIYSVRPFDWLWPLTAMAEGRLGLMGLPPLYALLAYSFLVFLARIIWMLAVATKADDAMARD